MSNSRANAQDPVHNAALPRRDWVMLPLICLVTILVIAGSVELVARRIFSESTASLATCFVLTDPTTSVRGIPNCKCKTKAPETEWIENHFNACGYLTPQGCGPKTPGTYRIVMTGSSVALGEHVQENQSLAAVLPRDLSEETGRKIEIYNESAHFGFSHNTAIRFNGVLSAQPDMVLWIVTPFDVESGSFTLPPKGEAAPKSQDQGLLAKTWHRMQENLASKSIADAPAELFGRTRTALLIRHYLYQSQSQYVKSYLSTGDEVQGFLKAQQSPLWQTRLKQFDTDAADIESRAKAAGVPFVAVYLPNRAQAAMISNGIWPAGYDPYLLNQQVRKIIESHGGTFIDILPDFRKIPNPERFYLPVDGHPNAAGHALYAQLIARAFTSGEVPAFAKANTQTAMTELEQKR
jgi:hypothetical protein